MAETGYTPPEAQPVPLPEGGEAEGQQITPIKSREGQVAFKPDGTPIKQAETEHEDEWTITINGKVIPLPQLSYLDNPTPRELQAALAKHYPEQFGSIRVTRKELTAATYVRDLLRDLGQKLTEAGFTVKSSDMTPPQDDQQLEMVRGMLAQAFEKEHTT